MADLLERSGVIRELVKAEEQARRERIARECQLSPEERAYLGVHTTPEQNTHHSAKSASEGGKQARRATRTGQRAEARTGAGRIRPVRSHEKEEKG